MRGVLDYIIDSTKPRPSDISNTLQNCLDFVVKKWIFGTNTSNLLQTILYCGSPSQEKWDILKAIFLDNIHTRAVYLKNQFNALHLSNLTDINANCQQLKIFVIN